MDLLDERLSKLIEAIISEYNEVAEPVGSKTLVEKYDLQVSPATVRNDMAKLEKKGFLAKPHFSAGRKPTPLAYRYYIKHLMDENGLPVVEEVSLKQKIWKKRNNTSDLIRESVDNLAQQTGHLSFALTQDDIFYHSGTARILDHPEFYNIELTRTVLQLLDRNDRLWSIFENISPEYEEGILLSEELGKEELTECGLVFGKIRPTQETKGYLAVLGPIRLRYGYVLPRLRYLRKLINKVSQNL